MNSNLKVKEELKLELDSHFLLLKKIVEDAFKGITEREVIELKRLNKVSEINTVAREEYFDRITTKYNSHLNILALDYNVTISVRKYVFYQFHTVLHQLPY